MRSSVLSLGAAVLALACSGCDHTRAPASGSAAAPAAAPAASVAQAQPPAGGASIESAPPTATAAPTSAEVAVKPAPAVPPAAPVAAPAPGSPADVHRVSLADANALHAQGRAIIVDVRDRGSYEAGHIAGAIHIPIDALLVRMNELPHDKTIITYCA